MYLPILTAMQILKDLFNNNMESKEFLEKLAVIDDEASKLYEKRKKLIEEYRKNEPFPHGTIVRIHFENGHHLDGMVHYKWELDEKTGEFRPNLCKVTKEGGRGKNISYPWQWKIVSIEKLADSAKCAQCLWKKEKMDKLFCQLQLHDNFDGTYSRVEVNPSDILCQQGKFVNWEDNIPWQAKFKYDKPRK